MKCPKCGYDGIWWLGHTTSKCANCKYVGEDEEFEAKE